MGLGDKNVATKEWQEILEPAAGTEVLATWHTRHMAGV